MNSFQKIVIITCIIFLIITLGILAGLIHLASQNATYPPNINDCPDYWDSSMNDNTQTCINNSSVNECKNDWGGDDTTPGWCTSTTGLKPNLNIPVAFGTEHIPGKNDNDVNCMKYIWARYEGVAWDGITNNKTICKNASFLTK